MPVLFEEIYAGLGEHIKRSWSRSVVEYQWRFHVGGKEVTDLFLSRNTHPSNAAGVPGITLPMGLNSEGLPLGLELDGPAAAIVICSSSLAQSNESSAPCPHPAVSSDHRKDPRTDASNLRVPQRLSPADRPR